MLGATSERASVGAQWVFGLQHNMAPNAAPRRNYYLFGRPFHTTAVDPSNADACDALYGAVRTQVELQMEYLLQRRGDDPYDDFVKRLAYEALGSVAPTFAVDE